MVLFSCAQCGKGLQAAQELAGKKVKCPGCGGFVSVPLSAPAQATPVSLAGQQTLPPPDPAVANARSQAGQPGVADAAAATSPGLDRNGGPDPALYDFLAPPQGPGEIGRLGPYRVLKVLGAGGMGVVFQAEDPLLKRKVALKAMLPGLAASASARQRFLREAQTAAALEHDHIVPIFQVGEDRGIPFIAMPFLKGQALDDRLKQGPPLALTEVVRIGRETALGLAAAHANGLIHRDIKPANLWLEEGTGRIKILDFGLARAAQDDAKLTQTGAIVGTPAYMAPEQANGQSVDGRTDLFSLGCVLYRLCTGLPAFQGRDTLSTLLAVATEDPRPPRDVNPAVPGSLSALVMQLLAKEPGKRPASADQVAALLANLKSGSRTAEPPMLPSPRTGATPPRLPTAGGTEDRTLAPTQSDETPARRPRWRLVAAAGGAATLVALVVLVFLLKGPGPYRATGHSVGGPEGRTVLAANTALRRPGALRPPVPGGGTVPAANTEVAVSQNQQVVASSSSTAGAVAAASAHSVAGTLPLLRFDPRDMGALSQQQLDAKYQGKTVTLTGLIHAVKRDPERNIDFYGGPIYYLGTNGAKRVTYSRLYFADDDPVLRQQVLQGTSPTVSVQGAFLAVFSDKIGGGIFCLKDCKLLP